MTWTNVEDAEFYAEFRKKHPWFFMKEEQSDLKEYVDDMNKAEA